MARYLAAVLLGLASAPALADDLTPKIAAHLLPSNPEIEISWTSTVPAQDRSIQVVCGLVTVRQDRSWWTTTFAYVVDDDKLWLTTNTEWMKEREELGVLKVVKYCPRR